MTVWMNKKQAANYAGVAGPWVIDCWMKAGLRFSKPGKKTVLFLPSFVDDFLLSFTSGTSGHDQNIDKTVNEIMSDLKSKS